MSFTKEGETHLERDMNVKRFFIFIYRNYGYIMLIVCFVLVVLSTSFCGCRTRARREQREVLRNEVIAIANGCGTYIILLYTTVSYYSHSYFVSTHMCEITHGSEYFRLLQCSHHCFHLHDGCLLLYMQI